MVYLHNMKKILHRDLKSSNVLIGEDWQVKLCDFGLSDQKKKQKKYKNRIGTYQWMAPEVIRNEKKIDEFADVYSFGVITW
jgi:serine/threonine protein kinase